MNGWAVTFPVVSTLRSLLPAGHFIVQTYCRFVGLMCTMFILHSCVSADHSRSGSMSIDMQAVFCHWLSERLVALHWYVFCSEAPKQAHSEKHTQSSYGILSESPVSPGW